MSTSRMIKLIVFDLNGVLVRYAFAKNRLIGYTANLPLLEFINGVVTDGIKIAIWTATKREKCQHIVEELMTNHGLQPIFVLYRESCVMVNGTATKPLAELDSNTRQNLDTREILIVDDTLAKVNMNPRYLMWRGGRRLERLHNNLEHHQKL